jgi:hypothetical protein
MIENARIIEEGFVKIRKRIDQQVVTALSETMWDLVNLTEVPVDTHNLWDSIGCGVYVYGVLVDVLYPPQVATEPRPFRFKKGDPKIYYWGSEELEEMIIFPPDEILTYQGYCLYYVAAQPYSALIRDLMDVDVLHTDIVKPKFFTHIKKL